MNSVLERARVVLAEVDSVEGAQLRNAVRAAVLDDDPVELTIDRFVVLGQLGRGAMGTVYSAYDRELDRRVAIKLMRRLPDGIDEDARARVLREARTLARLSHPHVVTIYDVGLLRDRVYITMELVTGVTLREHAARIDGRGNRWRELVRVYRQAAEGLAAAHAAGIVHRDFKPDNVLVGVDGRVRVLDFGLARGEAMRSGGRLDTTPGGHDEELGKSATGRLVGTPAYMAPEQHDGLPADARADQFAFCVSLWEALHRERPFEGESRLQLRLAVSDRRIRVPSVKSVPRWLRDVLVRGLAEEPSQRWPTMRDLLDALAQDPTRRQRRYAAATALLGLAALGLGGRAWIDARARALCDHPPGSGWDELAATRITDGFAATGLAHAPATATRVIDALSRDAAQWTRIEHGSCVARHIEHALDLPQWALRSACLDEHAARTGALVETLASPDRTVVRRALELVFELPSAQRCEDDARLAAAAAVLAPDIDLTALAQTRRRIARAAALTDGGRRVEAREMAEAALGDATAIGESTLVAEATLALADVDRVAARFDDALAGYQRAYFDAASVGADELELTAATRLVELTGFELARYDDARVWERFARVEVHRTGADDAEPDARLTREFGSVERIAGDAPGAEQSYRRARALYTAAVGPEHPWVGEVSSTLAGVLVERGELDEAARLLDEAEPILAAGYGEDAAPLGKAHITRCIIAYLRNEFAEANAHCRRAALLLELHFGSDHPSVASALGNLAEVLQQQGEDREAMALLERVWAIRRAHLPAGHPELAQTLVKLGYAELYLDRPELAMAHVEQALAMSRAALPLGAAGLVFPLLFVAEIHLARHEPGRALPYAVEAESIAARGDEAGGETHGHSMATLGQSELGLGHPGPAIDWLERAMQTPYATSPDAATRCELRFELAKAWRGHGGDPERARELIAGARTACDQTGDRALDIRAELASWTAH
jgi:eukaryotic-like serine/threonine-protein kinase